MLRGVGAAARARVEAESVWEPAVDYMFRGRKRLHGTSDVFFCNCDIVLLRSFARVGESARRAANGFPDGGARWTRTFGSSGFWRCELGGGLKELRTSGECSSRDGQSIISRFGEDFTGRLPAASARRVWWDTGGVESARRGRAVVESRKS